MAVMAWLEWLLLPARPAGPAPRHTHNSQRACSACSASMCVTGAGVGWPGLACTVPPGLGPPGRWAQRGPSLGRRLQVARRAILARFEFHFRFVCVPAERLRDAAVRGCSSPDCCRMAAACLRSNSIPPASLPRATFPCFPAPTAQTQTLDSPLTHTRPPTSLPGRGLAEAGRFAATACRRGLPRAAGGQAMAP